MKISVRIYNDTGIKKDFIVSAIKNIKKRKNIFDFVFFGNETIEEVYDFMEYASKNPKKFHTLSFNQMAER